MSEGEQMGRCRSEITAAYESTRYKPSDSDMLVADAIDRLAADVAAIKEKVDAISPEDVAHLLESEKAWVRLVEEKETAAIRERDEARALLELAQVQRTAAYADCDEARAEVYRLKCSMTETSKERDAAIRERDQWREEARIAVINRDEARAEVERLRAELAARPAANSQEIPDSSPADPPPAAPAAGWLTQEERQILANLLLYQWGNLGWPARVVPALNAILARAGSPPVVEVPELGLLGPMTGREQGIVLAYRDAMDKAGVAWKAVPRE